MSRSRLVAYLLALALAAPAGQVAGAEAPAPAGAAGPATAGPTGAATPRAAMLSYLEAAREGDHDRAARYLDLSRVPAGARATRGPALARELQVVLDRTLRVQPGSLSDEREGSRDDGLAPDLERVGAIQTQRGPIQVLLGRVEGPAGEPVWRVAWQTVAQVPALYAEFGYGALGELLPEPLFEIRWLEIALWQWIGILVLVLLAALLSWLAVLAGIALVKPIVARSRTTMDDRLVDLLAGPVRLVLALSMFSAGLLVLRLSAPVHEFFEGLQRIALIVALTWALLRLVDLFGALAAERLAALGKTSAVSVVPVGRKALKVVVVVLAGIAMLQNLGVNVTGVIAGLGVGGLAVALAAQKTLENLFGGLAVVTDQPVRVGDFCRWGDRVGTVEEVGLRSTRIRTLDRTVVSVPNAEFATLQLENFALRDRIWLKPKIGLRYETTPDQLRYVLVEVRRMLYAHERVEPEGARIRFVGFGDCSLDLEVFAYVRSTDFGEFLAIQEDVLLRIMDIVAASGTGFAFPSSTTYLARDGGLDAERSRAAEARVREWRERGELPLPEFSAEAIEAVRGTIAYPPGGTVRA